MIVNSIDTSAYPQCIIPPPSDTPDRSPGLHLSTIIRDIGQTTGIGKEGEFNQDDLTWFASMGWMWERVFDMAHDQSITRGEMVSPGEFSLDGITGTPDRVDWSRPALIELKCRWMSAYKFDSLEKFFCLELMQIKSYCWMLQILEADLVVFFVAGDWRPPVPCVKGANLQFTEMELEENWRQILGHAHWRKWL